MGSRAGRSAAAPVPVPAGAMHCAAASLLARQRVIGTRRAAREEVVGTLDYHVGARLPGEILEGRLPAAPGDETVEAVAEVDTSVAAVATFAGVLGEDGVASAVDAALALGIDGVIVGDGNVPMDLPLTDPKEGGDGYAGGGALGGDVRTCSTSASPHRRRKGSLPDCFAQHTPPRRMQGWRSCTATWRGITSRRGDCTRVKGTSRRRKRAIVWLRSSGGPHGCCCARRSLTSRGLVRSDRH